MMTMYVDLHTIEEDKRIEAIGQAAYTVKSDGTYTSVAFVTDREGDDGFEKANRYISKLMTKFPELEVEIKVNGPTPGAVTVKVQRRKVMQ